MAATSSTNAWAVGDYSHSNGGAYGPVIEHWNGRSWKVQASPKLRRFSSLSGVSATSSTNAWAVGDYTTASDQTRTLIEHWNGRSWKVQASPKLRGVGILGDGSFDGVAATSSTNAWAVGYYSLEPLIEHWNGRAWKIQASPHPSFHFDPGEGLDEISLTVAATSPPTPGRSATATTPSTDRTRRPGP